LAAEVISRELRVTHCYSCQAAISNSDLVECTRCRWIVCDCGACGCGHSSFRERYEDAPTHQFATFSEARAFLQTNRQYSLSRGIDGEWIASRSKPNKAPESTTMAVTPRADKGAST
jgi:hypothetical protein